MSEGDGHTATNDRGVQELDRVTIRFAGDSGDGSQVAGLQFTNTAALVGNDISTVPDFPAEIRAPAGSLPGVSSFQVSFSSYDIHTPGDSPDVLVAMNPAALKTNLPDLPKGGTVIVNTDEFTEVNLRKAAYEANPLEDGTLAGYRAIEVPITSMNARALKESGLNTKQIDRSKNFFALGLMFWLYERPLDPTLRWIKGTLVQPEHQAERKEVLGAVYLLRVQPALLQRTGVHARNRHLDRAVAGQRAVFERVRLVRRLPEVYFCELVRIDDHRAALRQVR